LINAKRISFDDVNLNDNTLILGSLAEQALMNTALAGGLGEEYIIIDFNENMADILKIYDMRLDFEYIGDFLKRKIGIFNGNEIEIVKTAEYIRYFLRTNFPITFFSNFLKNKAERVSEYAGILLGERYFHETLYLAKLLNMLFNTKIENSCENGEISRVLLSFKNLPLRLKKLTAILLLDYLAEAVRETLIAMPVTIFEVFSKEEHRGILTPLLSKIFLENKLVIVGDTISYSWTDYLLRINMVIMAGKIFPKDLNTLSQLFPQLDQVGEFLRYRECVMISPKGVFFLEDGKISLQYGQRVILKHRYRSGSDSVLLLEVLRFLDEKPLAKKDLLAYMSMNWEEKEIVMAINEVIARKLAVEYVGADGEYWLRITPLGRHSLAKGVIDFV